MDIRQADTVSDYAPLRRLSCIEALRERRGEVKCFTPALLVTHGFLPLDPAQDFIARFPDTADKQPFCIELYPPNPPFFSGLPSSVINGKVIDWNRRLYAISADRADTCFNFLSGIGISGTNGFFASSVMYELDIPDPLAISGVYSTIPVHIFGVFSNNQITYLAPNIGQPPAVRTINADDRFELSMGFKVDDDVGVKFKQYKGE